MRNSSEISELQFDQLSQVVLAFHNYKDTHENFPANDSPGSPGARGTGLSWRVYLLKGMDKQYVDLFNQFKLDEPWDSEHNKQLIARMPAFYGSNAEGKTRLHLVTGPGTPFQSGVGPRPRDIMDGMSNTILFVEGGQETAEYWTKPGGLPFDPNAPLDCLGTFPAEDNSFTMAVFDGRIYRVPATIEPGTFKLLVQHQDATPVGDFPKTQLLPKRPQPEDTESPEATETDS